MVESGEDTLCCLDHIHISLPQWLSALEDMSPFQLLLSNFNHPSQKEMSVAPCKQIVLWPSFPWMLLKVTDVKHIYWSCKQVSKCTHRPSPLSFPSTLSSWREGLHAQKCVARWRPEIWKAYYVRSPRRSTWPPAALPSFPHTINLLPRQPCSHLTSPHAESRAGKLLASFAAGKPFKEGKKGGMEDNGSGETTAF